MKKKILIVIVAVAMMIPLLAVGVCADYSTETGWSEPVGTVRGSSYIVEDKVDGVWVTTQISTYNTILYRMYLSANDSCFSTNATSFIGTYKNEGAKYLCRFFDGEEYTLIDGEFNGLLFSYASAVTGCLNFQYKTTSNNTNIGSICLTNGVLTNTDYFPDGVKDGAYLDIYVLDSDLVPLTVDAIFDIATDVYQVSSETHPFVALIELMFDNFSRIIGGLAAGITGAFTALIWENPEATEKSLSTLAKFIFTIAGLSIGMTVFYLVLRLIRFGRQR